jgi:hypothetical protein
MDPAELRHEELRLAWTDQYVEVNPQRPELRRFVGVVGRVVTVNQNGKALVDFQDGAWYDIAASADCLTRLDAEAARGRYDAKKNGAQPFPSKKT